MYRRNGLAGPLDNSFFVKFVLYFSCRFPQKNIMEPRHCGLSLIFPSETGSQRGCRYLLLRHSITTFQPLTPQKYVFSSNAYSTRLQNCCDILIRLYAIFLAYLLISGSRLFWMDPPYPRSPQENI
jgi:hypothetical protein